MTERFQRAFNALTTAYFEGTLAKGHCCKCAVGNLCNNTETWSYLFCSSQSGQTIYYDGQYLRNPFVNSPDDRVLIIKRALSEIAATGYTWQELAKVEEAFETNTKIWVSKYEYHSEQAILEDQYNGLAAVFKVLCELDGIEDSMQYETQLKNHPKLVEHV